jgi:hypothetical protein
LELYEEGKLLFLQAFMTLTFLPRALARQMRSSSLRIMRFRVPVSFFAFLSALLALAMTCLLHLHCASFCFLMAPARPFLAELTLVLAADTSRFRRLTKLPWRFHAEAALKVLQLYCPAFQLMLTETFWFELLL